MGRLFGTDGIRGVANADITPELTLAVAVAAACELLRPGHRERITRPLVLIGRDTRPSGELLEAAAAAGFAAAGCDVTLLGVIPTPAVAFLTAATDAELGLMISASHNPMPDNGLKLIGSAGDKLTDEQEGLIEAALDVAADRPTGRRVGRIHADAGHVAALRERYVTHLVENVPTPLTGLRVVVDCAEGAAYEAAPEVYRRAGADVLAIAAGGDGDHINDGCGATHLDSLRGEVVAAGADLGIAHDGDADRCLAVDAAGEIVDGDQILAICARALHGRGALRGNAVATTVMANLGFRTAMRSCGVDVVETAVGDRYVLEAMREHDLALGGEQSGHIVFRDLATTGDGLLTALQLMGEVVAAGQPLAQLAAAAMTRLPQVLVNVPVSDKGQLATSADIATAVRAAEAELGGTGRVLLRPSGTEPLVRVMVEAGDEDQARAIAERIAGAVEAAAR